MIPHSEMTPAADWYQSLVDDIRAMVTERVFQARWEIIRLYHGIGERLATDNDYQKYAHGNGVLLKSLSQSTNVSERDLYRSIQFYELFPDLDRLPGGKNISWNKIVNDLLPAGDEKTYRARTFAQRQAALKTTLLKLIDECSDEMDDEFKRRVIELLALFDEKYYDVVQP
jgi:hypothetical protein